MTGFGGMEFGDAFGGWFYLGSRDGGEEKVGFAEKKLRLWGIEAIDAIDAIEAIEGVEEIVWGIFLNRDCLVKFFWWVWGGRVKRNEGYPYVEKGKPSFVV